MILSPSTTPPPSVHALLHELSQISKSSKKEKESRTYTSEEQAVRNGDMEVAISQACSQKMPLQELLYRPGNSV